MYYAGYAKNRGKTTSKAEKSQDIYGGQVPVPKTDMTWARKGEAVPWEQNKSAALPTSAFEIPPTTNHQPNRTISYPVE